MQNELLIMIIDSDVHFRGELYNFLLSAGYKHVDSADDFSQALAKIQEVVPDVILIDVNEGIHAERIKKIAEIDSGIRVISMIRAEDEGQWRKQGYRTNDLELIIKNTFARYLLYMLHKAYI